MWVLICLNFLISVSFGLVILVIVWVFFCFKNFIVILLVYNNLKKIFLYFDLYVY